MPVILQKQKKSKEKNIGAKESKMAALGMKIWL